jgi:predicted small lipoprotein YifL
MNKKLKTITVLFLFFTLAGCSTKQIELPPKEDLKKTSKSVRINVSGCDIESSIIEMLTMELKSKLRVSGFNIVDDDENDHIDLNVYVTWFSPGNAGVRFLIGFGAGRGSLVYTAEYTDQKGEILAKMDGQERFTGMDEYLGEYGAGTAFGGEETSRRVLIKESAKHIVELSNPQKEPEQSPKMKRKEY